VGDGDFALGGGAGEVIFFARKGEPSYARAFRKIGGRSLLSPRWGFSGSPLFPTAYAVGFILSPLRGLERSSCSAGIADSLLPPVTALGTALQIPTQSLQTFTSAGDIVPSE
jgi:hypothetical protein